MIGLKSLTRAFAALTAGATPGSLQGSALQLGGAAIVSPSGEVIYHYISQEAGDHPDPEVILKASTQAA